jgi:predicted transcriptional regulator
MALAGPIARVSPELTIRELVENYIYRHHHKVFPVVRDVQLLGCVTTTQVSGSARINGTSSASPKL